MIVEPGYIDLPVSQQALDELRALKTPCVVVDDIQADIERRREFIERTRYGKSWAMTLTALYRQSIYGEGRVVITTSEDSLCGNSPTFAILDEPTEAERLEAEIRGLQRRAQRGDRAAQRDLRLAQAKLRQLKAKK